MSSIHQLRPEGGRPSGKPQGADSSGMDRSRVRSGRPNRMVWILLVVVGIIGITLFLETLHPAVAGVDRELVVLGQVRRGPMARHVYGWGRFVPDRVQVVQAEQAGRIAVVYVIAGDAVRTGDRLIEMSNRYIQLAADKAEQKFASARAGMIALSREQSARRLALEAAIADTRATYLLAEDELEQFVALADGKSDEFSVLRAKERLLTIATRLSADEERLELITASTEEQMAAQRDELRWLESILESERAMLRSLTLRASGDGIVEELFVKSGGRVAGGTALVRIALSDRLKAKLEVYASEGSEIEPGQAVTLESETAIVSGRVARVAPDRGKKVLDISVTLDENPRIPENGSHKVHAMIQLETLDDAIFVERPAYAASNESSSVFRISEDGTHAERTKVRFGRGSADRIEVLSGLEIGDRIIVSDVSEFDDLDFIEIR